jgi:hypothetical protein
LTKRTREQEPAERLTGAQTGVAPWRGGLARCYVIRSSNECRDPSPAWLAHVHVLGNGVSLASRQTIGDEPGGFIISKATRGARRNA